MAEINIQAVIKSGVEKALNKPVVDGKSITEWAAIGMKAPRWISVKDRLPEIPHENPQRGILVVDGNGNVKLTRSLLKTEIQGEILIFDDTHSDCFFVLMSGKKPRINTVIKGNHIVYWMPILEPPKENEDAVGESSER